MTSLAQVLVRAVLPRLTTSQAQHGIRFLYGIPGFTKRISVCPVCGAKPDKVAYQTRFSPLDHCAHCDHVFTRLVPGQTILQLMYKDLAYWELDRKHQGITSIESGPHWKEFVDARIGAMRKCGALDGSPKHIFELGCAEGMLLRELENLGHQVLGCECNAPVAEAGMQRLGVRIKIGFLEDIALPSAGFDVVASFHTVEHIPDLNRTFAKIADALKPDGVVFLEVPIGADDYANPDHVQFFSRESLDRLLRKHFDFAEVTSSRFVHSSGASLGSLYGFGRRPRKRAPY